MYKLKVYCGCGCETIFEIGLDKDNGRMNITNPALTPVEPFDKSQVESALDYVEQWQNRGGKVLKLELERVE